MKGMLIVWGAISTGIFSPYIDVVVQTVGHYMPLFQLAALIIGAYASVKIINKKDKEG